MDLEKELDSIKAKITPMSTTKFVMGTLVSIGATAAVIGAMHCGIGSAKGITKLLMKLGIFVMACKAGDMAEKYFGDMMDKAVTAFNDAKKEDEEKNGTDSGK